jgi:ABC-2 type transport system ATP-binding protein
MNAVVELDGLTVRFGRRTILDDLRASLTGRALGLLGPNGAGKTTLIHTLLGFHAPASGSARVFGRDVTEGIKEIRSSVGYMPERDSFVTGMTAIAFVRLMAELSGLPPAAALERAHEALFYVGLGEARYRTVETFSLGMKQQVKLAQAIVHGPRLIILDEPTNGLDPPARSRMLALIREIRDSGKATIILSSHLLRDVEECCEDVLVLKDGRVAVHCNLEEERRANRRFVELETAGDPALFVEAVSGLGCECAVTSSRKMKLILGDTVGVRDLFRLAATHEIQIRRLNFKRDSLEDIFLKAMEGAYGGL